MVLTGGLCARVGLGVDMVERERDLATEAEATPRPPATAESTGTAAAAATAVPPTAVPATALASAAPSGDETQDPGDPATQAPTLKADGSGGSLPSDPGSIPSLDSPGSEEWDKLPPPVFEVGRVVFGKYRLLEKIGVGGMGEVWRVTHLHLETERALKLIRPEFVQSGKGWRRFRREAQLMAKIDHPHAVSVYDFKRAHSMGYIEMELVRGRSLQQILRAGQDAAMPLERVAEIVDQLCDVLEAAHDHKDERSGKPKPIIHRDLKPSNLMLVERKDREGDTRLKVLDFGIAKMIEDDGAVELTGAGDLVGTPAYMSPEQIRGGLEKDGDDKPVDARSDIYSTGVVLYHLLTGSPPFQGNKMTVLAAHLNWAPAPFKKINPKLQIPTAVEKLVLRCLEKDPDERPASARELKALFREAVASSVETTATVFIPEIKAVGPPRKRPVAAALVAVIGLAAAVGLFAALRPPAVRVADASKITLPTAPAPARPARWVPEGYAEVDPDRPAPDNPSLPGLLRRSSDQVEFVHYKDGLYLPAGYAPDSQDPSLVGDWPKVVVRDRDQVRFVRVSGGVFRRGDPRAGPPVSDQAGNPCTPHFVRVPGFYIQEAETTNGAIEDYLKNGPRREDDALLAAWRRTFEGLTKAYNIPLEQARRYPAVGVDAGVARRYAAWVGGLLPTESEFEFAARSRNEKNLFPWGGKAPAPGEAPRANLMYENDGCQPAEIKQFPEDKTDQGVFDAAGNVREICADVYKPYSYYNPAQHETAAQALDDRRADVEFDANDPKAKVVVRGGSFKTEPSRAFAFYRWREPAGEIPEDVGFRVVIECPRADSP